MASNLKKTKVKLDLLTDIDMLLMLEKSMRSLISHAIHQDANTINEHMKYYERNINNSCILSIGMWIN